MRTNGKSAKKSLVVNIRCIVGVMLEVLSRAGAVVGRDSTYI